MGHKDGPLLMPDVGVSAYEKMAISRINFGRETSASFAMSALVNVGASCSLDELKALVTEVARIARDVGQSAGIDETTLSPVVEALDRAHDLIDEVHVIGGVCPTCSGSGEGRLGEHSRCHVCRGSGGQ